ncbi:MAG: dihydroorotate dehydrogenase [Oscillospiraceae bacterium]|nr:dihydroorotate dehydrogenase [Oscillospiraceae bacterium]
MSNLQIDFCGQQLQNPIITASGTFSARGSGSFYDFSRLGAVTSKGVAIDPWPGNPTPRVAETRSGMLNSIGLENPGAVRFIAEELPVIKNGIGGSGTKIIANLAGRTIEQYVEVARLLDAADVDMLELNISCPNVKEGGVAFGTSPQVAAKVTEEVRRVVAKPLIVKLSPNVTDICEIAKAVEAAGADAISMINTLTGMRIDVKNRRHILANKVGGLSGPAVLPVAIRMVYQVSGAVKIPILGMGGVMTGEDAAEFLMVGASAVAVGTAALVDPTAPVRILDELSDFMDKHGFADIQAIKEVRHGL